VSAASAQARRRVLLVDDDQDEYVIVGDLLRSSLGPNFDLTWMPTYAKGLEALLCLAFDVCLVDYRLGERTGLDFLAAAAAACCPTQIILLTGFGDRDVDLMATTAGAADYLVKGQITPGVLERSIRYAMERGRMLEALRASEGLLERAGKIAGIGGWSYELLSGAVHWSNETCRIHDLKPGYQPSFDEALDYYRPASRSVIEAAFKECVAKAVAFDLELQVTTARNRCIWVRSAGEAQIERGEVVRIVGAFQDITARKLAERNLIEHDELLRVTLDSIGDAVITTDARGAVQSLNAIAARLTGWSVDQSRGRPIDEIFNIIDAQTRQRTAELMTRALSNAGPAGTGMHTVLIAHDGIEVAIEDTVTPIRDKTGIVVGSVVVFRDVSERQKTALELRTANDRFKLAADAACIGVWEWDLVSHTLCWDDQMYRLYGRMRIAGEEPYSLWATSLHSEDRERAEREINEAVRDRTNFDTEFRIVQPGGEIRFLKVAAQTQCDAAGTVVRMIGVNFDVTARKRAELDLKHTSSVLRIVLDSATDLSIIAGTPDMTIRVFNKGAEKMLGYAGAELIDTATPLAFHDPAEVEARALEMSDLLGRRVQGVGVFNEPSALNVPREWTYIRKDRRRIPVLLNLSAMYDDSGALSGYMGLARDITKDREHERTLREAILQAESANAAKSEFLANMSHEIRTPLNAVIGLGYLLEQTPLSGVQRSFLRKINFAGHSLLSVINNVLDLSKIEAGEMLLEEADLDLVHLVQSIGQMLNPSAHAKDLVLVVRCAADLPPRVRGDAIRLGQIATNLLSNAIKFTDTGQVELELTCSNRTDTDIRVRLAVRDSGIGIDAEGIARLFRPFSQADTSTTRRFGGTGLGLSIARRFAALMGGQIGVTSTVGVGSEFWVEVPLRLADAAAPCIAATPEATSEFTPEVAPAATLDSTLATEPHLAAPRVLSGAKILVVDDSDINCEVAQHILEGQGAAVATSGTGAEALERLRQTPNAWDVVLMDVQMPEMDGNEATRRIRTQLKLKALPIIALTAGAMVSERARSLQAGMNDFLTKPYEPVALIGVVRRCLEQKWDASMPRSRIESPAAPDQSGEELALFVSLRARLLQDFSEFSLPVSVADLDDMARTHMMSRLHKLKGSAGLLGAADVYRQAGATEAALVAGHSPERVEPLLRELAAAFTALSEEIAPIFVAATGNGVVSTGELRFLPTRHCGGLKSAYPA
jgi:PAS domain S-box-containing protein